MQDAARAVREVGRMMRGAEAAGRRLPTLSVDTEIRFASAADRAACADELAACIRDLAVRYHHENAPDGRWYRLVALPGTAIVIAEGTGDRVLVALQRYSYLDDATDRSVVAASEPFFRERFPLFAQA